MTGSRTPTLEKRDAHAIARAVLTRLPAYVPGWIAPEGGPGWALTQIFARYLEAMIERLNQAPDKNKLAFLDMLGINLMPAQASRVPVVFEMMPNAVDGYAPVYTRLGATIPGRVDPLIFETEKTIGLAGAKLSEVVTLWPGRDAYADHSEAAIGGQPFTLFEPLMPVPHEIYLAHDIHFALAGESTVELKFDLATHGSQPLSIAWEYWDGEVWCGFKDFTGEEKEGYSFDGTEGLTRSGVIRLESDCAASKKRTVDGIESHWIRGRLEEPITQVSVLVLPIVARIGIFSVLFNPYGCLTLAPKKCEAKIECGQVILMFAYFKEKRNGKYGRVEMWGPNGFRSAEIDRMALVWSDLEAGAYKLRVSECGISPFEHNFTLSEDEGTFFIINLEGIGISPDIAFTDGVKVDLNNTFYPFGQQPQTGSVFHFSSQEVFSKLGAKVTVHVVDAVTPQNALDSSLDVIVPTLEWEYWNGNHWKRLPDFVDKSSEFLRETGTLEFSVPKDIVQCLVNNEEGLWARVRIKENNYGRKREIIWKVDGEKNTMTIIENTPPALSNFRMGYSYRSPEDQPHALLSHNDFQWEDHTPDVRQRGVSFVPFSFVNDRTPVLYLGFDKPLPAGLISLYLDIQEQEGLRQGPALKWEYWDGAAWASLTVKDETNDLALPGMIAALWPGVPASPAAEILRASGNEVQLIDSRQAARFKGGDLVYISENESGELANVDRVSQNQLILKRPLGQEYDKGSIRLAELPRFGKPRTWMRARLQSDGEPLHSQLKGIFPNAVWAAQVQTIQNELLGSSTGQAHQTFFFRQAPVLNNQIVEVRELEGARAPVELPILKRDVLQHGLGEEDLRVVTDPRTGDVREVWVCWQEKPHLLFSGPEDRHYVLERSRGRLTFGDGLHGNIPPPGADNIRARMYRTGGGVVGNVTVGAVRQVLGAVPGIQGVSNPRPAEGGADGEPVASIHTRGPQSLRHRRQAISLSDYEALAREASPAVAVARALPATHPSGRPAAGWVKVIILPKSFEARPQPSFELRRLVHDFLADRSPASIKGRITVSGPDYLPIGVEAVVAPVDPTSAGDVLRDVTVALKDFLHPLVGGPGGNGWPFGRDVFLSDVAAVLETVEGVDYVHTLHLLLHGTPSGEFIDVPPDRIVVAGPIRIRLTGTEE